MDLLSRETKILQTLQSPRHAPAGAFDIRVPNGAWSDTTAVTYSEAEFCLFEALANAAPFHDPDLRERLRRHSKFHLPVVARSDYSGAAEIFAAPTDGPCTPPLTEMIDPLSPAGVTLVESGGQFRDEGIRGCSALVAECAVQHEDYLGEIH